MGTNKIEVPEDIKKQGADVVAAYITQEESKLGSKGEKDPAEKKEDPVDNPKIDKDTPEKDKKDDPPGEKPEDKKDDNPDNDKKDDPVEPFWGEILGEQFKTKEDVIAADIPKKLKEYQSLSEEIKELKTKLDEVENPFVNDTFLKINELAKSTGRVDYATLARIVSEDFDEMDDIDVLIFDDVYNNPGRIGKEDLIKERILSRYNLDREKPGDEATDDEIKKYEKSERLSKMNLEDDAKKARDNFRKIRDEIKVPEKMSDEEIQKKQKEQENLIKQDKDNRRNAWGQVINEYSKSFKQIPIFVSRKEGDERKDPEELLKFSIPEDDKKECLKQALDHFVEANIPLKEESLPILKEITESMIIKRLGYIINDEIGLEYVKRNSKQWSEDVDNPSALRNNDTPSGEDSYEDKNSEAQEKAKKEILGY